MCSRIGVNLRRLYSEYKPKPVESSPKLHCRAREFVERKNAICTLALSFPWWGYKRIAVIARREGWQISDRKVYKILKHLHLLKTKNKPKGEIYQAAKLFELLPDGPNQLFQTDVTYIHIPGHGWWYAVTVIDYYSRYLLACHLTPSYRALDCVAAMDLALDEAERISGLRPKDITLVTDNGSSFLARRFRQMIKDNGWDHARIQYRTPNQLGLLERFHKTLKHEEVYWNIYKNPEHARENLEKFRIRYNTIRPHWALIPENGGDPVTPIEVYRSQVKCVIPEWQPWAKAAKKKIDEELSRTITTDTKLNQAETFALA